MAISRGIWGIDIGQCALKAMRCTWDGQEETVVADGYDFIEYPKILSQPDANPTELVQDALEEFLSRNDITGDEIAISVSGQVGLSRFFKPPPVDTKTLPKVVEFEAKQQIPFPLDDVIWDFQQIGGIEVDGLLIDAEIGIFAMKREAVFRALQPYIDAEVEVDIVQLAPLATYNCVLHEILNDIPDVEEIDPDNPPPSLVVLSIGTDTTDLVVTDGHKLWLRNIPIGGSHFTKQLSRDLKLTYAKAEHLKRNARQAEDPKTIFQAMRPVFSDLVTEIQRSINFFQGIEKNAKIGKIAMLGNASKLPGLRQYLAKHLGTEILKLSEFEALSGEAVTQPTFESNLLSYSVCYGLCLQGLGHGKLNTNLLPREFKIERLIRAKKPWTLASIGILMLAFACVLLFKSIEAYKTDDRRVVDGKTWSDASSQVKTVKTLSGKFLSQHDSDKKELEMVNALADEVAGVTDERRLWPELLSVISQTRPTDARILPDAIADPELAPFDDRDVVYITKVESEYFLDLDEWFNVHMQELYKIEMIESGWIKTEEQLGVTNSTKAATKLETKKSQAFVPGESPLRVTPSTPKEGENPLKGQQGWVVQIDAYHYHNGEEKVRLHLPNEASYVRLKWLNRMRTAEVVLPGSDEKFLLKELGLDYFVVSNPYNRPVHENIPNLLHPANRSGKKAQPGMDERMRDVRSPRSDADKSEETETDVKQSYPGLRYDFSIQFVWQPVPLNKRLELLKERKKAEDAAAEKAGETTEENPAEKSVEKPAEKIEEKPAENAVEKTDEREEVKADEGEADKGTKKVDG